MEDGTLPASALATRARIAPSTASGHLAKLAAGRLVVVERHGRHRYFRLADPAVAAAIEALAAIAPERALRSLREASVGDAIRFARTCYDHLAGRLGVEVTAALERDRVLVPNDEGYGVGPTGSARLGELGVDLDQLTRQRRALARRCLDWSERRPHLGGALGAAVATRFFDLGWLRRREGNRSVEVTSLGREHLRRELGVELED